MTNRVSSHLHGHFFCWARLSPRRLFLRGASPRAAEKKEFSRRILRSRDPDIFLRKKMVGRSFHVILMKVHARTGRVAVAGLEKMLAKVPWLLGEVSL